MGSGTLADMMSRDGLEGRPWQQGPDGERPVRCAIRKR